MKHPSPSWLVPVLTILTLQTLASFMARLIPVMAPAMARDYGWDGSSIGYLAASHSLGGVVVLVAGSEVLRRTGGTRSLQVSLLAGALSLGMFYHPSVAMAIAACFIMGTSTGTANPAGSEVLQRFSPPDMRNLLFSIKQAGVPLGGMVVGVLLPFLIVLSSWQIALLICAVIVALPTALSWRLSEQLDGERAGRSPSRERTSWLESIKRCWLPLTSLTHNADLLRISIVGALFAIPQSCWFTFTAVYLVDRLHYSLSLAGLVYAVMQLGGVLGRVFLGWLADHLNSARLTLTVAAVFSALTTTLLGLTDTAWPLWAVLVLAFIAGGTAASWNGVQIAETARHSPPHLITETASGASLLVSAVNVLAPTLFALTVAAIGRYDLAFFVAGACALLVLVTLPRDGRPRNRRGMRKPPTE